MEGKGSPICSAKTHPSRTTYPWCSRNSSVRCMWGRGSVLRLFLGERSSMPPATGHDKFGDGLACSRRHFAIFQVRRQRIRVASITDGNRGDGVPSDWNSKDLARFFGVKTSHLMDEQAVGSGFHGKQHGRRTSVVLRIAVGGVVLREGQLGDGNCQHGSALCPVGVEFHENAQHFLKAVFVVFCGHEIRPGLLVAAGRRPSGSFENAAQNILRNWFVGESPGAPTFQNQIVDGVFALRWFLHSAYSLRILILLSRV